MSPCAHRCLRDSSLGLFCVSFHFRSTDEQALTAALQRRNVRRYRIAPGKNGWTSLYEQRASMQDDRWIRELAGGLSSDLNVAAIAFMVHDSDIACYRLYDNGQLVDDYSSCPDYFSEDDGPCEPQGGQADVLLRYCLPGVQGEDLETILHEHPTFAEDIIGKLAPHLGIDEERALADFRDGSGDFGDAEEDNEGEDDDGPFGGPTAASGRQSALPKLFRPGIGPAASGSQGLLSRLAGLLGGGNPAAAADPKSEALVQAAAADDVEAIGRLLAEGVDVEAEAATPLPQQQIAGLGQVFSGRAPTIALTPLITAVMHKHHAAAAKLLDAGADPNRQHALFGSSVHVGVGGGDAQLLELLLARGGDPGARSPQGKTPLEMIAALRGMPEKLARVQTMMRSLGTKMSGVVDQLAKAALPIEGWDACEKLLKKAF